MGPGGKPGEKLLPGATWSPPKAVREAMWELQGARALEVYIPGFELSHSPARCPRTVGLTSSFQFTHLYNRDIPPYEPW